MATDEPASEHALRASRTYGAAADHYRRAPLGFWDRFGAATVSRLRLPPGGTVLDLCCGAGASAIPAARAVGPAGTVLGIDVAAPLLELARARAADEGLANIEFRHGDATRTGLPDGGFDAVVCVFGVFFAPDMAAFAREMWRLTRPRGVLAVTTWGPGLFEPANSLFWRCLGEVEPALFKAFNPWDEITAPAALAGLFSRAGVPAPAVVAEAGQHRLDHPDRFWDIVLGSGYRATVDALSPEQRDQIRQSLLAELRAREIACLRTDAVFGTAARPPEPAADQAGNRDGQAERDGRDGRARISEPQGQGGMAGEPGDDRRVDGAVKPVRRALVREQGAEHRDEDRAASEQDTRPGTGGGGQQGPAGPRAFHEPPREKSHHPIRACPVCLHR